jgi:hypothetical protein
MLHLELERVQQGQQYLIFGKLEPVAEYFFFFFFI